MKSPSSEPVLRSRLLPQFSFRLLMGLTAGAAVLATLFRFAEGGAAVAQAVMFSLGTLLAMLLLGAVLFLFSWVVATLTLVVNEPDSRPSPFAEGQLPPQTLPPRDRST